MKDLKGILLFLEADGYDINSQEIKDWAAMMHKNNNQKPTTVRIIFEDQSIRSRDYNWLIIVGEDGQWGLHNKY